MAVETPKPDCHLGVPLSDNIAITGISCRLPKGNSLQELKQQLFDGVDLKTSLSGFPTPTGRIKDLQNFDATFFGVHANQAYAIDPQLRLLLELTHEAIVDAGVNPTEVRGSKTGVFIGMSDSETSEVQTQDLNQVDGYELTGCIGAMFPKKISHTFDFAGPSNAIFTAGSSSLIAFQQAVTEIKTGECNAAIIGSMYLLPDPTSSPPCQKPSMLSPQGIGKDSNTSDNGWVRLEAAVVVYLQKASASRRVYATVLEAKANIDEEQGITVPSDPMQSKLVRELCNEIGIEPQDASYVESHSTGDEGEDQQEVIFVADFFCGNSKDTSLIGSIRSNMGHFGHASGLCSIAKMVIAMEAGMIPQNLHVKSSDSDIAALIDVRLKTLEQNESWNGIIVINAFGFGVANAHIILKSNQKPKTIWPASPILRVIGVSGTTQEAVEHFLAKIEQNKHDEDFLGLIDVIHAKNVNGHAYRGYALLKVQAIQEVSHVAAYDRPIVFIFSGTGSQWPGMAKDLMQLECFKKSIKKCSDALKPRGINLEDIIVHGTQETFENILNSFISIVAMQIALTDVLRTIGIKPDLIVGQSVGELGSAYADGAFTVEQTILSAYCRGRAVLDSNLPPGAMAAVGLTWEETKKICPPEIIPASYICEDCIGVSGTPPAIERFVADLKAQGIFAKAIDTSNMAFHSKYIADAGPRLLKTMGEIIPDPKPRSAKWISSSIPESEWDTPLAQRSSAEYHVNNMVSPILFHQAMQHVPENAIVIEIAPSGLMQTILKRSLGPKVTNVCLVERGHSDNVEFLLSALGKIYNAGAQPKLGNLYRPIDYPVGRSTPMISPMIEWNHSVGWPVPNLSGNDFRSGELDVKKKTSTDSSE